jgi:parallel beta-helix repeat protein
MSNKSRLIGLGAALVFLAATFIVVTSTSSAQVGLAQAGKPITVCASGCDFAKIQAAIDAASAGATIQVQTGSYKENLSLKNKQGLTLQGAGINWVTLDGSAGVANQQAAIVIQNSQKITIQGLKIINSRRGVDDTGSTELVLAYNSFQNNLRQAIALTQDDALLTGNLISNTQPDQDGTHGEGVNLLDTKAVLKGNTITGNATYGIVAQGTSAQSGSTVTMQQNTISDNGTTGVGLYSASTATLDGNTIARDAGEGIYVSTNAHAQITNNQITATKLDPTTNGGGIGIAVTGSAVVTITNNRITGSVSYGVQVYSQSQSTLRGNTITGSGLEGIRIGATSVKDETLTTEISDNTVQNNQGCGAFSDSDIGITITGQGNTISGNAKGQLCGATSKFPAGFGGGK